MAAEDVPARAAKAGQRLSDALANLPAVVDVRGAGLLVAAELARASTPSGSPATASSTASSSTP